MGQACPGRCPGAMRAGGRFGPDWRDSQAYAPLLGAERALLAWEWLRRDPAYRKAAESPPAGRLAEGRCGAGPGQWGLHAFEPPELAVPGARPVWRLDVHPYVLSAYSAPGSGGDILDLGRLAPLCRLVAGSGGGQHLLICDGLRSIRIDIIGGTVGTRVRLRYLISGFEAAEKPLVTLRRLLALRRSGRFSSSLHPVEARGRRFVLMLRAGDALAAGASQREIAAELLDRDAVQDRWRVRSPSLRSRAQRLVGSARAMAEGGYRSLLSA